MNSTCFMYAFTKCTRAKYLQLERRVPDLLLRARRQLGARLIFRAADDRGRFGLKPDGRRAGVSITDGATVRSARCERRNR